jgi:hypothetical protein
MQPIYVTKKITTLASSNLVGSVSTAATSVATVNSSNMPLDTQRRIVFTSTAADTSSLKLTFTGTREGGGTVVESVTGSTAGAGTNATTLSDFLTVTAIGFSSNANVPVLIGVSSAAGTPWKPANWQTTPINLSAAVVLNSSQASATWEFTLDDVTGTYPNPNVTVPSVFASTGISGAVGSSGANFGSSGTMTTASISFPVAYWRMTLTSSSSTYLLDATVLQAGIG